MGLRIAAVAALGAMAVTACPALAQDDATMAAMADGCASCHGPDGRSPGSIPSLAGKEPADLVAKLWAFKSGGGNPTVMDRIVRPYGNEQLMALALFLAGRESVKHDQETAP